MAISLELEAINSIFEASFRLHDRSRPVSWQGGGRPLSAVYMHKLPAESGGDHDDAEAMNFESLSHAMKSIPAGEAGQRVGDVVGPSSSHINISHFEELNEGIGPLDRLRYELVIPLYEEDDVEWTGAFARSPSEDFPSPPVVRILVSSLASQVPVLNKKVTPLSLQGLASAHLPGFGPTSIATAGSLSRPVSGRLVATVHPSAEMLTLPPFSQPDTV